MLTIKEIQKLVCLKLEKEPFLADPQTLYEPIDYIMSMGGKRLRPMLVVIAGQLYGKPPEELLDAALGIEVFHNFTLVHDDIMDRAPIRRGKSTVHTKWNLNTAILSGDTMMVMAYDLLLRRNSENIVRIIKTFNQVAREVCEGQQLDIDFEEKLDVTMETYMEMIRLKTSVLMAAALKIGGLLANAPESDLENLYKFGEKIGLAFQVKDDLLDVYGDEKKFGKQQGNDIITNKKTYLLVRCLTEANLEDRLELEKWISESANPEEKINAIMALYKKYDLEAKTHLEIESLYLEGMKFLEKINLDHAKKIPLIQFADSLKIRES